MHKLKRNREIILKTMMRQFRRDLFHVSTTLPNTFKIAFNVNIFLIHILVKAKNSRQTDRYVKRNRFSIQFRLEIIILTKTRHNFTDSWHKIDDWNDWIGSKWKQKKKNCTIFFNQQFYCAVCMRDVRAHVETECQIIWKTITDECAFKLICQSKCQTFDFEHLEIKWCDAPSSPSKENDRFAISHLLPHFVTDRNKTNANWMKLTLNSQFFFLLFST